MSSIQAAFPSNATAAPSGKAVRISLWAAQVVLAAVFCMSGVIKLTIPIAELSATMPWTGDVAPGFVRLIGMIDLAGGLGILLPSLTRIQPRLTVLAALGCIVLQLLAFAFHSSRGEFAVLPMNVLLVGLSAFVLWGRAKKAPVAPRRGGR